MNNGGAFFSLRVLCVYMCVCLCVLCVCVFLSLSLSTPVASQVTHIVKYIMYDMQLNSFSFLSHVRYSGLSLSPSPFCSLILS